MENIILINHIVYNILKIFDSYKMEWNPLPPSSIFCSDPEKNFDRLRVCIWSAYGVACYMIRYIATRLTSAPNSCTKMTHEEMHNKDARFFQWTEDTNLHERYLLHCLEFQIT